jgi:hypothetical protein
MNETSGEQSDKSNIISLDQKIRERQLNSIMNGFSDMNDAANDVAQEYYELMERDTITALGQLGLYLARVRKATTPEGMSSSYIDAISGGPNQNYTAPIIDIAASHYAEVSKETRLEVLNTQLAFLDRMNNIYAARHVGYVQDPTLLADIINNRRLYWPFLDVELDFLESQPNERQFYEFTDKCRSIGLLGYAIIATDSASLPIRRLFREGSPQLLDGVLNMAAGRVFHRAAQATHEDGTAIVDEIEKRLQQGTFDLQYHDVIRQKIADANWVHKSPNMELTPESETRLVYVDGALRIAS